MKSHRINYNGLVAVLLLLHSFVIYLICDVYQLASISIFLYLGIIVFGVALKKSISLELIWELAFVFVILSEMVFCPSTFEFLQVSRYIILGNNMILLSYNLTVSRFTFKNTNNIIYNKGVFFFIFFIFLMLYVYIELPSALFAFQYGRRSASLVDSEIGGWWWVYYLGYILPAFISYFYRSIKRGWIIAFVLSLPIFVILFMNGTRFPLLFSFLGFVVCSGFVNVVNFNKGDYLKYLMLITIVAFGFSYMKDTREKIDDDNNIFEINHGSLSKSIASFGSPEGVVQANVWIHDYCKRNGHTYGKQSAFIFYWWVPRKYWPNKPQMTGGWIPYLYGNYNEGHSASVGLWGELYVDFGYFAFLFLFLFGRILKWLNSYCNHVLKNTNNLDLIKVAIIYSFAFFSVRSPITSFITLCVSIVMYEIFRLLACKSTI